MILEQRTSDGGKITTLIITIGVRVLRDVKYLEVTSATVDGDTLIDLYRVGHKPVLRGGNRPYRDKIIESIELNAKSYTMAAFVYYDDLSMQYVENIRTFYAEANKQGPQGDTPAV